MMVLKDAESVGNGEDIEAVLEEAADIEERGFQNMLAKSFFVPVFKSLDIYRWTLLCLSTSLCAQGDILNLAKHSLFMKKYKVQLMMTGSLLK